MITTTCVCIFCFRFSLKLSQKLCNFNKPWDKNESITANPHLPHIWPSSKKSIWSLQCKAMQGVYCYFLYNVHQKHKTWISLLNFRLSAHADSLFYWLVGTLLMPSLMLLTYSLLMLKIILRKTFLKNNILIFGHHMMKIINSCNVFHINEFLDRLAATVWSALPTCVLCCNVLDKPYPDQHTVHEYR